MPINLLDIRSAVKTYLDTKVTVSISTFQAEVPNAISPGERFTFNITAANANAANGGLRLINVRYHLKVDNAAVPTAKLIVPNQGAAGGWVARTGPLETDTELTQGTEVSEMFLFPYNNLNGGADTKTLEVGESDTITNLEGKAINLSTNGTDIQFDILADVDLAYLIPKNEKSATASRPLVVT